MLNLPSSIITIMSLFSPLFSQRVFQNTLYLMAGHILNRSSRTVTNCLRMLGLKNEKRYSKYHDIFRSAKWSSKEAAGILLIAIIKEWLPHQVLQINIDTTLERRRGPKIFGIGSHRDAVYSTQKRKVTATGHNWLVAAVVIQFPGAKLSWSLPFLSILLTPEKALSTSKNQADKNRKKPHKKMTRWAAQIIFQLRRWLGSEQEIVVVADSAFCCRLICRAARKCRVSFISRLRLDARLFEFPSPKPFRRGRPRLVGKRLPNMDDVAINPSSSWASVATAWYGGVEKSIDVITGTALWYGYGEPPESIRWVLTRDAANGNELVGLMCTNADFSSKQVIERFVNRWSLETTFQELRELLKFETLRTWADKGIERVSPSVIASYSIICLIASKAQADKKEQVLKPYTAAWYPKEYLTFSDLLVYVRILILNEKYFPRSSRKTTLRKNDIEDALYRMAVG